MGGRLDTSSRLRKTSVVWLGLVVAIVLDTAIQLCWKTAVSPSPSATGLWSMALITLNQPLLYITLLLILIQFVNWMTVLAGTDLSYSQPITALSLISVTVFSHLLLHEHIPFLRIMGMMFILTGVWFISSTGHRTVSCVPEGQSVNLLSEEAGE